MKEYEIIFQSVNSENYSKPITVFVVESGGVNAETGAMLFTHGWGGNRFQHLDKMEYTADKYNLVCVSVEYRQSGFDFNSVTGQGSYRPYDGSFFQVFDVLNGFRTVLDLKYNINRKKLYHYGGSQGGHISLISSIFAPNTFVFTYASSPIVQLTTEFQNCCGREFFDYELSVRNVVEHADLIKCPLFLEHGTEDDVVPHDTHTEVLVSKLKELGKKHSVKYYQGGDHQLAPAINKIEAFQKTMSEAMKTPAIKKNDDFLDGNIIEIMCCHKKLIIDWSKPTDDVDLFSFMITDSADVVSATPGG